MWSYNSPIGAMIIKPDGRGRFNLWINGERYGNYHSPRGAADDVASFSTGCHEWDKLFNSFFAYPSGLDDWEGR